MDILIIGAGPAGLFAASELARHGVAARLIERDLTPHRQARATAIQAGTLEILESAGVLPQFLDTSVHIHGSRIYGPDMTELRASWFDAIDCRFGFQCSLPQYETERILTTHLESLGGTVERGVNATKIDADGDDVQVELAHADGRVETVHADVIIGAGGAQSITRHSMHDSLDGATYEGHFLVADIAMASPFPEGEAGAVCTPEGMLMCAPLPGGRWISFQEVEPDVASLSAADVADRIARRFGGRHRPTDVAWYSPFRMHRRMVARMADGKRFLIGDAAHLSSPFGGEGLNSALHDGFDLAWKLALVHHGHAQRSLLDDYAIERAIADRHVLAVSEQVHQGIMGVADSVRHHRHVPAAIADPVAATLFSNARAMLDVDYAGSPLVADGAGNGADGAGPRPGQRYPDWTHLGGTSHRLLVFGPVAAADALAQFERRWSGRVALTRASDLDPARAGIPAGGCVLVRPDGHIGFRHAVTDTAALAALDRHLASYLIPVAGG